jgi:sortase A
VAPAAPPSSEIYLKLTVPKLGTDGIAINSDWTGLKRAGMVHYAQSPAPGRQGNVLLAFHRETHWYEINQLRAGDDVQLETTDQKVYTYRVDFVRIVPPSNVDLLKATDGHDLTMITCDPIWQDYNRMIFRAHLVGAA